MEKTEIKKMQVLMNSDSQALLERFDSEMLANLMHNLPGMAYRCKNDFAWTMIFLSEGAIDLTGYEVKDLINNNLMSYEDLIVPEDREYVRAQVVQAATNGNRFQMNYRIRCKNGELKWVLEKGNVVYANGNPDYLDGFIIDVTSQRKAEEHLRELNATKDRFFSLLAHDLQNPVYAIISLSEFVAEGFENLPLEEIKRAVGLVHSSARGIHTLLENLLDWARLQSGQIKCNKEIISLHKMINYAMEHYAAAAAQKGIILDLMVEQDSLVESDLSLLSAIMRNLISNAIKYSYPKSTVKLELKRQGDWAQILVQDFGTGIPRKNLPDIFRIDSKLKQYGTANEGGSGLGLVLVNSFARITGARIEVQSKLNHGTTFSVWLHRKID